MAIWRSYFSSFDFLSLFIEFIIELYRFLTMCSVLFVFNCDAIDAHFLPSF